MEWSQAINYSLSKKRPGSARCRKKATIQPKAEPEIRFQFLILFGEKKQGFSARTAKSLLSRGETS
jgi:hypothetical protein